MLDPKDLGEDTDSSKLGQSPLFQFLFAWGASFVALIATFSVLSDFVPPLIKRIFEYAIPISIILSLLAVAFGNITRAPRRNTAIFSLMLVALIAVVSLVTMAMPDLVFREDFETIQSDLERLQSTVERLQDFQLSPSELEQLRVVLIEQGFVTSSDLDRIFGDARLQQEVLEILHENDFVTTKELESYTTSEEVIAIVQAEATRAAAASVVATETATASTCFVEPLSQYSSVWIRKTPAISDENKLRALYAGEQMIAVGHNGRTVNVDRWWLVKYWNGEEETYGWIASDVVREVTETSCSIVEQIPGS